MKALVAEIHKDHCIAITRDGKFVRQDIPAGAHEIGDEIVIEAAELYAAEARPERKSFGILARLSAGFAAVVILGGGAYLGIKYAGPGFSFGPVKVVSQAAQTEQAKQAKIADLSGQEDTDGGYGTLKQGEEQALAAEATASEPGATDSQSMESSADATKSGQSSSTSNQDSGQSDNTPATQDSGAGTTATNIEEGIAMAQGAVLYEETFKLEKNNIDILLDYADLNISYVVKMSYGQDSGTGETGIFTLKIKNFQKSTFTGNIDIIFTDANSGTLQTSTIEMGILGFNDVFTQQNPIAANADSFKITLYGSFDET